MKTTTHAACYTPRPRSFSKEPDAHHDVHLPTKMHSQLIPISISGFDCISAFETSDFRQRPSFRFQTSISGFRLSQGLKSKSRLRFQVSDFRLSPGSEIEIETSISGFRFQTLTRERNRNRDFDFNFKFRFQTRLLRETKSNLEMTSGFHFCFRTELSITRWGRIPHPQPQRQRWPGGAIIPYRNLP